MEKCCCCLSKDLENRTSPCVNIFVYIIHLYLTLILNLMYFFLLRSVSISDPLLLFEHLDGLKSHNELACEKYEKNGETYLKIKKYSVTFSPDKVKLNFDNLFDGDKVIGIYQKSLYNYHLPNACRSTLKN